MLKNEGSIEFAIRLDSGKADSADSFLEDNEFKETIRLLVNSTGWLDFTKKLKGLGYSEFKIGYCIGELKNYISGKKDE